MKAEITVTHVTQTANKELGVEEKKLYYLIVQTDKGKETINIGQKTHDKIKNLGGK